MTVVAVIPTRLGSTRFPEKCLADATGKTLTQHVYERASAASCIDRVIVACDDDRIASAVRAFGGEAVLTSPDHENGTSRIAEVAESLDAEIIVNVQGDEPELDPASIDVAVETLRATPGAPMSTLAAPLGDDDPNDPNIVKVVTDRFGRALLFSRAPIPHDRDGVGHGHLRHVGLYVYRRDFLAKYVALSPTPLETTERLEQLRVLEHGHVIAVGMVEDAAPGIDTPEQYEAFVRREGRRG